MCNDDFTPEPRDFFDHLFRRGSIAAEATLDRSYIEAPPHSHELAAATQARKRLIHGHTTSEVQFRLEQASRQPLSSIPVAPEALRREIVEKNRANNKARMVAGYCWDWNSKKNPDARDVAIPEFAMTWNLTKDGGLWIVGPESVNEIG